MARKKNLSILGIEIDSAEIRIVEMSGRKNAPRLINWSRLPLPEGLVSKGRVDDTKTLTNFIVSLCEFMNVGTSRAILGIMSQEVIMRKIDLPYVPFENIGGLIKYQVQDYLPMQADEVYIDHLVIGEHEGFEGKQHEVLLVAASKELIHNYMDVLTDANLQVIDITVSPLALMEVIKDINQDLAQLTLDLSFQNTSMMISINGFPRYCRNLTVGLDEYFTDTAKVYENQKAIDMDEQIFTNWINRVSDELIDSIAYYQSRENFTLNQIVLTGIGARISGIVSEIQDFVETPVTRLDLTQRLDLYRLKNPISPVELDFSVCIGLGISGLED